MKKCFALILLLTVVMLVACANPNNPEVNSIGSEEQRTMQDHEKIRIAFISHVAKGSFFEKIQEGAEDAATILNIELAYMGTETIDLGQQVSIVEAAIDAGYDGIVTSLWDDEGFNSQIIEAHEAGIPIIAFNVDAPNSGRDAFIGQDAEESGYKLGKEIFERMGGKGEYIIASFSPGVGAMQLRIQGIKRAQEEYPQIEFITTIDMGDELVGAVENIKRAYEMYPQIDAILGTDAYSEAIGNFIAQNGLKGKVLGGGFDLTPAMLDHIKEGTMQVTVGQSPYLQGYYPIIELYAHIVHNQPFVDLDTGYDIVTIENVWIKEPE